LARISEDVKDTEEARRRQAEAKAERLRALGTAPGKTALGRNVGAVQGAARVLAQRYFKPKRLSTSNWALPTPSMRAGQLVYACRDALLPLVLFDKLRSLSATAAPSSCSRGPSAVRVAEPRPTERLGPSQQPLLPAPAVRDEADGRKEVHDKHLAAHGGECTLGNATPPALLLSP
jgi:hypothetical protein